MRAVFYSIVDVNTNKKITVGISHIKAEKKLAEMTKMNPKNNYKISYKWGSI